MARKLCLYKSKVSNSFHRRQMDWNQICGLQFLGKWQDCSKTQLRLDTSNNGVFSKVDENVDRGGWGTEGGFCNGAPDQRITWVGQLLLSEWDTATDVDFKNLSVREISPSNQ